MGCIVYTDYVYPAFVTLLADISCLLFLFRKCLFVVVVVVVSSTIGLFLNFIFGLFRPAVRISNKVSFLLL